MKRTIPFLAVCMALMLLLCACNTPDIPNVSETTDTQAETTEQVETIDAADTTNTEFNETTEPEGETNSETEPDCTHADADDNGTCDLCTVSVMVTLDFFALNDLHGKFNDTDDQPGVDELSTYLELAEQTNPNTILLSSGDMWQGSAESGLTKGLIITDWMNAMGFAAMTLGNHEFDWGEQAIYDNLALAEFPFLAINIYERDTNTLADYCTPSVLIDKGEVQIGLIGAIGDCYSSISADKVEDVYFVTGNALTELVKAESEALRAQGADIIVYSIHDGGSEYDYALSGDYVDLVFEGHTHKNYVKKDSKGIYHLQGGGDNDGISHAETRINYVTGSLVVTTAEYLPTQRYASFEDHEIVAQLGEKYADQLAQGNLSLGHNAKIRYSNQIKQKVADLYIEYGMERWGAQYDLVLGGGFISTRSPYDLAAGEVQYADLQMLLPFDNQIVLCSIKGSDLLSKFIHTSNSNYYIAFSDYGKDIKNTIDRNATYYIVTDSYCSSYAPNRLTVIDTYDQTTFARDLIAEYIKDGNWSK